MPEEQAVSDSIGSTTENANGVVGPVIPIQERVPNEAPKHARPKRRGPNYAQIHSKPLPLSIYPLPAFHPTHPISLLRLAYTFLVQLWSPPSSHPEIYTGYFSPETRSVHITDPREIRALWEMGFFGKGTLSRSEPSWMQREKAQIAVRRTGGRTAEEATLARREERRLFKLERARAEREKIERQRMVEEGKLDVAELGVDAAKSDVTPTIVNGDAPVPEEQAAINARIPDAELLQGPSTQPSSPPLPPPQQLENDDQADDIDPAIEDQEHLQLTLEEAFFLSYALGVLSIRIPPSHSLLSPGNPASASPSALLPLFSAHSSFPALSPSLPLAPDSPFLLNYVVYHHFRSLGWVVRSGLKFSVDYLLYNRGPVFAHAEFAVLIWPSYADPAWRTEEEGQARRRGAETQDWWWLHCVNRVQSQVRKSLVVVYVEVPAGMEEGFDGDVGGWLKRYKVREFVVKRWLANRSRD